MGCVSYFSNWDPVQLQDCLLPDMDMIISGTDAFLFQPQPQPRQEEASPFGFDHLDTFVLPQETFCPNPNPNTDVFNLTHDLDSFFPTPKRQKIINSNHFAYSHINSIDSYLNIVPQVSTTFPAEFRVPDFPATFDAGKADQNGCDNTKKPPLSAQSIAARDRRRRIAEKTQELGKLIPGGPKLNTAEMFQAAAKYVKFLQAQVGILRIMQTEMSTQDSCTNVERETCALLASQAIQEKLSSEEVCLVPKKVVRSLASDESIWRTPKMFQDINKLLSADD